MSEPRINRDNAILKLLVRTGQVPTDMAQEVEAALAADPNGTSVIEWLATRGVATEEQLARLIATQLRLSFANLAATALDPTVIALLREDIATRCQVVPLRAFDRTLIVATANPFDRDALRTIEFATGRRVELEVATPTAIRDALGHAYHLDAALDAYLRGVPTETELPVAELQEDSTDINNLLRDTALPPVIKLFNLILVEGIRNNASDVHIEAGSSEVRVRYRIDGVLEESFKLPKWVQDPLIARCKVLARLDITERRVPQDGRLRLRYRDAQIDLRVSSLPTQFGEKLTMRILDATAAPTGLDDLGLTARDLICIRQAIVRPEGMVLVTGPTGSGKSTTLYGMIAEIISPTRNIVTIENPIEYQIRGVNQVEINEKQGLTFAGTLRSILRQDPDVILVGEIRDHETAEIALRAAQTGHLVLSTLHTNDAVATITRLVDIGIEPYMLASSLHAVIAQRLVRRVCEHCAEPVEPDGDALRALQIEMNGQHRFRRGQGCGACHKSGYSGRMAVFEVMAMTPSVARLIEGKASESALRLAARAEGMRSLCEHAASKVCSGLTTVAEVLRVVDVPNDAARCPACNRVVEDAFVRCPHCATPLHHNCSSCGMKLQGEWQVCPYCGAGTKPVPAAAPALPTPPPAAAANGLRQFRALVVDDQADFRRILTRTLEHSGMPISVATASSGAEALECAEHDPPDVILLDIMMPEMDGFEVCERLRSNVRTAFVPILMLTALDDAGNRARGFLAGTDDYIGKPFARAELLARLRRIIERSYGSVLPAPLALAKSSGEGGAVVSRLSA